MDLSRQELADILRIVEDADVEFLELEVGDSRLTVSRNGTLPDRGRAPAEPRAASRKPAEPQAADHESQRQPPETADAQTAELSEGCVPVTAPTLGVVYRRPEPGAPPFVEPGAEVAAGDTVALIEVMKVFNAVASPVAGVVDAILVADEQLVEYGQPIAAIRPSE